MNNNYSDIGKPRAPAGAAVKLPLAGRVQKGKLFEISLSISGCIIEDLWCCNARLYIYTYNLIRGNA